MLVIMDGAHKMLVRIKCGSRGGGGGGDRGSAPPPPWKVTSSMGVYGNSIWTPPPLEKVGSPLENVGPPLDPCESLVFYAIKPLDFLCKL